MEIWRFAGGNAGNIDAADQHRGRAETDSRPAIRRRVVDLPQPEGPSKTAKDPASTSKLMSSTARAAAQCLLTPCTEIAAKRSPS